VFTVPDFRSSVAGLATPQAFIWSGLSKGGENRYLPVLFDQTDSPITKEYITGFGAFSGDEEAENPVKPIVYQSNSSQMDPLSVEITHSVRPVAESEVDTDLTGDEPVRRAATYWRNTISDRSLQTNRIERDYGFLYQLRFSIYGTQFRAEFPVFVGKPSESTLRDGLEEAFIPCAAIVPDDFSETEDIEDVPTWVDPTIYRPK